MKTPGMIQFITLISGVLFCRSLMAAKAYDSDHHLTERNIPSALASILCERPATGDDLIKNELFDAQVDVIGFKPKDGSKKITLEFVRDRAKKLASANEQLGFAYGVCAEGGGWAMAFPSPSGFSLENNVLKFPGVISKLCVTGSLKTAFVPESRGHSLGMKMTGFSSVAVPSQKGYAAVSCVLKMFPQSGPREWALVPVSGANPDASEIGRQSFSKIDRTIDSWINEKRRLENLPSMTSSKDLFLAASSLIAKKEVRHNLSALGAVRDSLLKKGIEALGEDRVRGRDIDELVGLIWMSPLHRDLVLNPVADAMGIAVRQDSEGFFAVILVGKKLAGPVAKNSRDK